ncbi:MAG TPA: arylamine N-acetyltransferase [Rhizomicrobium sp.]|jgi:N-hydroxyarylamine O-acetyltransferase|nr:arylamine N-acetyltransferase [Rhizomicrobium sp.]
MNLDAYLARIGLDHRPPATLAGLTTLHRAHLTAISYENIDVQLGRPLTTSPEAAFDKIVGRRRGGWCYEMNGIFGWALGELGFDVTRATGAVMRVKAGDAKAGNHLVLRVALPDGVYLADVGFGDGPFDPVRVVPGAFTTSRGFPFALTELDENWWRLTDARPGAKSFDFNLAPADEAQLAEKCAMLQTAPASPFVQNLVVQRHAPDGHAILRGRTISRVTPAGAAEQTLASADELVATLHSVFDLDVPDAATLWPKICARHEEILAQRQAAAQA